MIYTGTLEQCEAYNSTVTDAQNYQGRTSRWANIRKHPTKDLWCIVKHDDHNSDMTQVEALSEDWFSEPDMT